MPAAWTPVQTPAAQAGTGVIISGGAPPHTPAPRSRGPLRPAPLVASRSRASAWPGRYWLACEDLSSSVAEYPRGPQPQSTVHDERDTIHERRRPRAEIQRRVRDV